MALSDILTGGAGLLTDYYTSQQGIDSARQTGIAAQQLGEKYGQQANTAAQFKPFTVTTGMGSTTAGPNGFSTTLTPEQQAAQQQLFGQGLGLMGSATTGLPERQQTIYDQMAAIRAPGNERARLELEQRLFNQGRTGVNTSAYGGTPEQLALAKAMQEQQSADLFSARNQGLNEMVTQANVGQTLFNQSYIPQQQLIASQIPGNQIASMVSTGNQQGAVTQAELQKQGLLGLLQGETNAGNLQQQQLKSLGDILMGRNPDGSSGDGLFSKGFDALFGAGGLFTRG